MNMNLIAQARIKELEAEVLALRILSARKKQNDRALRGQIALQRIERDYPVDLSESIPNGQHIQS